MIEDVQLGSIPCEKLSQHGCDQTRAILYLHGGGFVAGAPTTHRPLTWRLARQTNLPVYVVDYRLAPEHPFPAGLDDCFAAYQSLLAQGIESRRIAIIGDSAGGNLALATTLKAKTHNGPLPGCLVCLSPVTDLVEPGPSQLENARSDALFVPMSFTTLVETYCPGRDASDPLISPLRGDLSALPPTLLQCSGAEMLRDDSVRIAEKMRAAGTRVELEIWPKVPHVWQVLADVLPEARQAINKICRFVTKTLAD
jgi:acetyl esterase/lipase